ncbi:hypothetical protein HPB51_009673 [Rhipicephalus microplus]|uniref:Uncharacterized protein n=1 Tax=Rhipicephalus microplus TaxID=6941 RepID=A0A9J6ES94_RHIMP|nr:hypothetical protein HPB51_009673 [Rhipicephalus microplus]
MAEEGGMREPPSERRADMDADSDSNIEAAASPAAADAPEGGDSQASENPEPAEKQPVVIVKVPYNEHSDVTARTEVSVVAGSVLHLRRGIFETRRFVKFPPRDAFCDVVTLSCGSRERSVRYALGVWSDVPRMYRLEAKFPRDSKQCVPLASPSSCRSACPPGNCGLFSL